MDKPLIILVWYFNDFIGLVYKFKLSLVWTFQSKQIQFLSKNEPKTEFSITRYNYAISKINVVAWQLSA